MIIYQEINHPHFGEVTYDVKGNPVCHICGKSFKKVLSHVWQKHGISAKEYKYMFGLDTKKGIASEDTREKLRKSVKNNYDVVVEKNLNKRGKISRFSKGYKGRTRDMISEQTMRRLVDRIERGEMRG